MKTTTPGPHLLYLVRTVCLSTTYDVHGLAEHSLYLSWTDDGTERTRIYGRMVPRGTSRACMHMCMHGMHSPDTCRGVGRLCSTAPRVRKRLGTLRARARISVRAMEPVGAPPSGESVPAKPRALSWGGLHLNAAFSALDTKAISSFASGVQKSVRKAMNTPPPNLVNPLLESLHRATTSSSSPSVPPKLLLSQIVHAGNSSDLLRSLRRNELAEEIQQKLPLRICLITSDGLQLMNLPRREEGEPREKMVTDDDDDTPKVFASITLDRIHGITLPYRVLKGREPDGDEIAMRTSELVIHLGPREKDLWLWCEDNEERAHLLESIEQALKDAHDSVEIDQLSMDECSERVVLGVRHEDERRVVRVSSPERQTPSNSGGMMDGTAGKVLDMTAIHQVMTPKSKLKRKSLIVAPSMASPPPPSTAATVTHVDGAVTPATRILGFQRFHAWLTNGAPFQKVSPEGKVSPRAHLFNRDRVVLFLRVSSMPGTKKRATKHDREYLMYMSEALENCNGEIGVVFVDEISKVQANAAEPSLTICDSSGDVWASFACTSTEERDELVHWFNVLCERSKEEEDMDVSEDEACVESIRVCGPGDLRTEGMYVTVRGQMKNGARIFINRRSNAIITKEAARDGSLGWVIGIEGVPVYGLFGDFDAPPKIGWAAFDNHASGPAPSLEYTAVSDDGSGADGILAI